MGENSQLQFNPIEFDRVKAESGYNAFTWTPQQWIKATNAIGIISKSGRYGGTYAHTDIAFEFVSWIFPELKFYIIKDYQRLKKDEADRLAIGWDAKRELSKINYRIHTDAVKEFLITPTLKECLISSNNKLLFRVLSELATVYGFYRQYGEAR